MKQKYNSKEQNRLECWQLCLSLSDDKEFIEMINNMTHNERVEFLLAQGFTYEDEEQKSPPVGKAGD